jgi:hypothetical protein
MPYKEVACRWGPNERHSKRRERTHATPVPTGAESFHAGIIISPHVRTATIPPMNIPMPVNKLIFPGSFSGAKTSVRMNLLQFITLEILR